MVPPFVSFRRFRKRLRRPSLTQRDGRLNPLFACAGEKNRLRARLRRWTPRGQSGQTPAKTRRLPDAPATNNPQRTRGENAAMLIADSQVHLWTVRGSRNPWHSQVDTYTVDELLAELDGAGGARPVLAPPTWLGGP